MSPDLPAELFRNLRDAEPDPEHVAAIQKAIASSTSKVRPLPSETALTVFLLLAFVALAVVETVPVGFAGARALSVAAEFVIYGAVLLSAGLLAVALTEQMIPGTARRVPAALAVVFPVLAMAAVVPMLFPEFGMERFVPRGLPCLRLGLLVAIPSGALAALFIRRGYLTEPFTAAVTAGALSGLAGLAVLSLHCPIQNAAHILMWHMSVIVISIIAGAALGWIVARYE